MAPLITVSIVTYNSREEIARCLECVFAQTLAPFSVYVWDNGSTDGTVEILRNIQHPTLTVEFSKVNLGFCAAHNSQIHKSDSEYVFVLNPDCYLESDYLEAVVGAAQSDPRIGAVSGKLIRLLTADESFDVARSRDVLDSTGMYFTPSFRHFDRGSEAPHGSQYSQEEWVFGVTGAAALYRRAMLTDIEIEGECFDEGFFAYREDADLAWRMQSAGWKCLYEPRAVGYHVRRIFPTHRERNAPELNMHSVKNRFLFRLNNISWQTAVRFLIPTLLRDLAVVTYVLFMERDSLAGLSYVIKNWKTRWRRRKLIQRKRRVPLSELHQWIHWRPTAWARKESLPGMKD